MRIACSNSTLENVRGNKSAFKTEVKCGQYKQEDVPHHLEADQHPQGVAFSGQGTGKELVQTVGKLQCTDFFRGGKGKQISKNTSQFATQPQINQNVFLKICYEV